MDSAAASVDVLVVGAGPVGLACALEASRQGLSHVVVEKGALLNTLVHWPTYTIFFSTPELLEIGRQAFREGYRPVSAGVSSFMFLTRASDARPQY